MLHDMAAKNASTWKRIKIKMLSAADSWLPRFCVSRPAVRVE